MDHIHYYKLNMEQAYKEMDLHRVLRLTEDFFINYVAEIFVTPIRKRTIAYPLNPPLQRMNNTVISHLSQLLSTLSPLLPFTTYHITRIPQMSWPSPAYNASYNNIP